LGYNHPSDNDLPSTIFWEFSGNTLTSPVNDFFRSRIDQMIDLRLPLPVLASHIPWQEIEASLAHNFARKVKAGKTVEDIGLFGNDAFLRWCQDNRLSPSTSPRWGVR
jgi:hypothetical protein